MLLTSQGGSAKDVLEDIQDQARFRTNGSLCFRIFFRTMVSGFLLISLPIWQFYLSLSTAHATSLQCSSSRLLY